MIVNQDRFDRRTSSVHTQIARALRLLQFRTHRILLCMPFLEFVVFLRVFKQSAQPPCFMLPFARILEHPGKLADLELLAFRHQRRAERNKKMRIFRMDNRLVFQIQRLDKPVAQLR
ncbi:MAG: hypothetical protein DELT_03140 [Desulfovibrio sp.]